MPYLPLSVIRVLSGFKLAPLAATGSPIMNQSIAAYVGPVSLQVTQLAVGTNVTYWSGPNTGSQTGTTSGMIAMVNDYSNPAPVSITYPIAIAAGSTYTVVSGFTATTPHISNFLSAGSNVQTVALQASYPTTATGTVTNVFIYNW